MRETGCGSSGRGKQAFFFGEVRESNLSSAEPVIHSFCRLAKIDSAQVWEGFLIRRDTAIKAIQVFLSSYVKNSLQWRFVLDARERVKARMVNNASTVVLTWRLLVAAADFHIMEPKRQTQPKKARFWKLLWLHDKEGRVAGPGFKVVLVRGFLCYTDT